MTNPKRRSLAGLDLFNFFQADTQTGIGPFLAVYLFATRHWDPGKIGIAMFAQGIAVVLAQTPAGAMVDALRTKRMMIEIASLGVAAASIAIVHLDGLTTVVAAQVVVGVSSVVIPLAIAALTILGELLATIDHANSGVYMAACIIVAQAVMTPIAILAGRYAERWGRKRALAIGFAVLPIRGLLYTMVRNPYALVAIQILDGIGAGILGVVSVIIVADLAGGTGRFNFIQGAINTGVSIGASVSNLMTGFIVQRSGYNFGFVILAMIAAIALASLLFAMPETKDTGDQNHANSLDRNRNHGRADGAAAAQRRT